MCIQLVVWHQQVWYSKDVCNLKGGGAYISTKIAVWRIPLWPVLFLFCVTSGVSCRVLPCSLLSCCCFSPFSTVIISLWEKRTGLCDSRACVYFACVNFCPFSLPLRVGGGL